MADDRNAGRGAAPMIAPPCVAVLSALVAGIVECTRGPLSTSPPRRNVSLRVLGGNASVLSVPCRLSSPPARQMRLSRRLSWLR